ncbi:hypothetical protein ACVILK_003067 [Bradyrhizobium embrapense]
MSGHRFSLNGAIFLQFSFDVMYAYLARKEDEAAA